MLHSPNRLRIAFTCLLSAIPAAVFANDGAVLIDQSRALAGNVTPGDAPGFPVTINQPGKYRLTGNLTLTDPNTTAIQILSDSVTLDLNGFTITGPALCTAGPATICPAAGQGIGVASGGTQALGPQGVRVLNGSVRGMGLGIHLTGDGSFVERVSAYNNAGGGISVAGTVIESSSNHNGQFGIVAITVRDCTTTQNLGDGILIDGTGGVATGNFSSVNGGYGILVPHGTATNNTVFFNKGFGISANCPSTIVNNTVTSGETSGIETKGTGCVLANNAIRP